MGWTLQKWQARWKGNIHACIWGRNENIKFHPTLWYVDLCEQAIYVGKVKEGLKHGNGKYTWANGEVYIGDWANDRREGQGLHTWPSGASYAGQFKNDKRHGKGKISWDELHYYDGDWLEDERSGRGIFQWPDGERYEGEFKAGACLTVGHDPIIFQPSSA
jgi:hypothetical protein